MINKIRFIKIILYVLPSLFLLSCSKGAPAIEGMVFVPKGEFVMGSNKTDDEGLGKEFGLRTGKFFDSERPEQRVNLASYYIDIFEVTNSEYKLFFDATKKNRPTSWADGTFEDGRDKHPVNNVTWYDARAYCEWAGKRLPSEAEWEKAARGPDGNEYPWGMEYDKDKANLESGDTSPVGSYKEDKSYYGVYDMSGNVMEWVEDWLNPYPGATIEIKDYGEKVKVLRGGAGSVLGHYIIEKFFARGAYRSNYIPDGAGPDAGFRCASSFNSNNSK
jgi:formylglycine-generating enzyme required for sulfatase activity